MKHESQTYNQIIQYNKSEFLLINNQTILKYDCIFDAQYNFGPYNSCVASTSQDEMIYALCQVNSNYQIISINFSNPTYNNNLYPNLIVSLPNQSFRENAWLRIQNNQLYIWNDENHNNGVHMYFINQRQEQQGQFICISASFGFQTHQIQMGNSFIINYMYFKPIHKDQLYYKFAKIDNQSIFTHRDENSILLESITHQYFSFDTIPMIFRKNKEIILMISNSNFNLIVHSFGNQLKNPIKHI
ncbi:unnamed protein product (macronuclear) [Paramecium tetraurelia]|uniref:Transmembrane protein n=1 Tax=Paramecium tetraurelia TaxID=5888 RepID=A0C681_PARTE|nr:uncharacterized protein GSPATT00035427001 [Paramecium tetraurelia]CAK66298.1 unnamed protein product [Paramecium tetraurelia]|eukprot:XP_001433695.1 hypothetical protein (macronuclear) [Paramecium tetraurelia strain d4-2]